MKIEFKRILCATDLSDLSNQGVFYGIELAKQFEARLYLCYVIDLPVTTLRGAAYAYPLDYLADLDQSASQILNELVGKEPIEWQPLVKSGSAAITIADLIDENAIDLAIVTTHGRSGLKRLILGSVAERLVRTVASPLLIVPPNSQTPIQKDKPQPFKFKNILIGCDFSSDSQRALNYGLSLAQDFQAVLHLVHVIEPIAYRDTLLPGSVLEKIHEDATEQFDRQLHDMIPEEAYQWCDINVRCLAGRPFEELIKYAEVTGVDLIIMGVRGRGLMETMLLGATTDRVIRRAQCPVLSVSPV